MITRIQRYFQHHFKAIFAVLLAVTIVSFIFTIGASPGLGRGDRRVVERHFFGYNLSLPDDQARLFGDAQLSASLSVGSFGGLDQEFCLSDRLLPNALDTRVVDDPKRTE